VIAGANAAFARQPFFLGFGASPDYSTTGGQISDDGTAVLFGRHDSAGTAVFRWTEQSGAVDLNAPSDNFFLEMSADGSTVLSFRSGSPPLVAPQAWRWTAESGGVDLPPMTLAFTVFDVGGPSRAISADGRTAVVRTWHPDSRYSPASYWSGEGGMREIGGLPGTNNAVTSVNAISANGAVLIGTDGDSSGTARGFRWTEAGGFDLMGLDSLPDATEALSTSADGSTVVGVVDVGRNIDLDTIHSIFRWTAETGVQILDNPPNVRISPPTLAYPIVSADGSTVICWFQPNDGSSRSLYRWRMESGWQDLDMFLTYGLSSDGSVIASSSGLWYEGIGFKSLTDVLEDAGLGASIAGWSLGLRDLSADGRTITGYGLNPQGEFEAFVAFLGSAVPEPNAMALMALALTLMMMHRRAPVVSTPGAIWRTAPSRAR